ncbi:FxsB family radical SAM/SPASM domain protein [Actinocorallia sp. API 0066]|nr:FxsB family radical SAM/SPASM domain protein [Actinocorallia sp. API 0066]
MNRATEWPDSGLDISALHARGWRPEPFREFILKVHGRCNLACDYCYVYESADQSWRSRPRAVGDAVVRRAADRIAEHAARHGLGAVEVVLHGGEPLLAGAATIELVATAVRAAVPAGCRVDLSLQTNGVLLDEPTLDLLDAHGVGVAVSLDGDATAHDRHRRFPNGKGSHPAVTKGLELLAGRYRHLYRGLLCAVDTANDPVATYEALLATSPPQIDFLLPHGTWDAPPPGLRPDGGPTRYAEWMIAAFDRWYGADPQETGVRLFEEILNLTLGGASATENIGLSPVVMLVVETDGTLQQVDTLKTSYPGAPETGLTVFANSFDEALAHPGVVARQIGLAALCGECRDCPVRDVCGGGAYAHRYRAGSGYLNRSVYCADLRALIGHIGGRVRADLAGLTGSQGDGLDQALKEPVVLGRILGDVDG